VPVAGREAGEFNMVAAIIMDIIMVIMVEEAAVITGN